MKKMSRLLILCSLLAFNASVAFAHPPSDIKIEFNSASQTLTAVIRHRVSNPDTHYISKIDIGLNGKEIKTLDFTKQETKREQTISIAVPEAKKGDSLSVEAYCNLSGKLEKEIKVA